MGQDVDQLFEQAVAAQSRGKALRAERGYISILKQQPRHTNARYNLSILLLHDKRWSEALLHLDVIISQGIVAADVFFSRGRALSMLGRHPEALSSLRQSLQLKPTEPKTLLEVGNELMSLRRFSDAIDAFKEAHALAPRSAEAAGALGQAMIVLRQYQGAADLLKEAVVSFPKDPQIAFLYGQALYCLRDFERALGAFQKTISLNRNFSAAYMFLLYSCRETARWDLEQEVFAFFRSRIKDARNGEGDLTAGQGLLYFPFRLDELKQLAAGRADRIKKAIKPYPKPAVQTREGGGPIRVGYLSADFRQHPMMQLVSDLFEAHDRKRFSIHGYSVGPLDNSYWQHRGTQSVDTFTDLSATDLQGSASKIVGDGLDILVDLSLYTQFARPEIPAMRVAPVQMQWIGFPGTSGGSVYDYIIADEVVIPEEHSRYYSESILWMPDSYFPNRRLASISAPPRRTSFALPEDAFVFCSFNTPKKIDQDSFMSWCRILAQVPNSVLWLMEMPENMRVRLRQRMADNGIDPARLIFALKLPLEDHLARHQCADLFLDNFIYGAHTTASDALRAGLPVLTVKGPTFASRVASSILAAAGMSELICENVEDYENLAISLGTDQPRLNRIKDQLKSNLPTASLFDVDRFRTNLEAGFEHVVREARSGRRLGNVRIREILEARGG